MVVGAHTALGDAVELPDAAVVEVQSPWADNGGGAAAAIRTSPGM